VFGLVFNSVFEVFARDRLKPRWRQADGMRAEVCGDPGITDGFYPHVRQEVDSQLCNDAKWAIGVRNSEDWICRSERLPASRRKFDFASLILIFSCPGFWQTGCV